MPATVRAAERGLALALCLALVPFARAEDPGFHFERPLRLPVRGEIARDDDQFAIGDVDGDGNDDVVVLHRLDLHGDTPIPQHLEVIRGRRDGGFEFPVSFTPDGLGAETPMRLVNIDEDAAMEILVRGSSASGQSGFLAFDFAAQGPFGRREMVGGINEWPSPVDIDLDGRDDLFSTYATGQSNPPPFTWALWWTRPVLATRGRPASQLVRLQGGTFQYSGIVDGTYGTATPPLNYRIDLDGDGFDDAVEGDCPAGCLWRWQPWSKLVAESIGYPQYRYGELNGDGLADGIRMLDRESSDATGFTIAVQTSRGHFEDIGTVDDPYFTRMTRPQFADLDNNGLSDIVFPTGLRGYPSVIAYMLQTSPGTFTYGESYQPMLDGFKSFAVADMDRDGCLDVVLHADDGLALFRGHRCARPSDLRVTSAWRSEGLDVDVTNVDGPASLPRLLRVDIALRVADENGYGFRVTPPAGCAPARDSAPPRRLYDCALPSLPAGGAAHLGFAVHSDTRVSLPLVAAAFLASPVNDVNPRNDRIVRTTTLTPPGAMRRTSP